MSEATQKWTVEDGTYRFFDGEASFIGGVRDGVCGDDKVAWYLEQGYELERVYVLTQSEYDALTESRRLPAEATGEWEVATEDHWGYFNVERNGRVLAIMPSDDMEWDNGYCIVPLPDSVRIQHRRRSGATSGGRQDG